MSNKAKKSKKRKEYEQRQAKRVAQKRQKRKEKTYNPCRYLTRNQKEVAKRLIDGEVTMISSAGWGFVERFLVFLNEVGIFELLEVDGARFYRKMINVGLLIITYEIKILLGIASMNQVADRLFKDIALMRLMGYSADQLASGFCKRGYEDSPKPMHKNTLADAMEKLTAEEVERVFNGAVQLLSKRGVFLESHGVFALDSSDLPTTERYEGAGRRTKMTKKRDRKGQLVEIPETTHGFKVFAVYEMERRLVVAVKVTPINPHDSNFTLDLVQQAETNLGPGVLQVLLVDRGFLDGESLWTLKHKKKIDFIVPAKRDMKVTKDARSLAEKPHDGEYIFVAERAGDDQQRGQVALRGLKGLLTYNQYGDANHQTQINRNDFTPNPINVLLIQSWHGHVHDPGKEKAWLTSLPIDDPLFIYDLYDLRSLIENCLFRELKQGWNLLAFPKKTADVVRAHVYLTILVFNLTNLYRTHLGQDIADLGVRRQRLAWADANKVFVFAGDYYAIFDLEELLILLGREPEICWRVDPDQVRRIYGLPPLERAA